MVHLPTREVFKAALRILLHDQKSLEVTISPDAITLHLPVLRDLSPRCSLSHSEMIKVLQGMERHALIRKKERIGIWTRPKGNRVIADPIDGYYKRQAARLLGEGVLLQFMERFRTPSPELPKPDTNSTGLKIASQPPEILYSPSRKVLKSHICISCGREFFTNDVRRTQCDVCKPIFRAMKRNVSNSLNNEK